MTVIFLPSYFSAQTFAYKHVPPYWTEMNLFASSVHFGRKPNRKRVLWFTEPDESKSLRFRTKPNQTEPGPVKVTPLIDSVWNYSEQVM